MRMETFTKANGRMIKLMAMEYISTPMGLPTMGIGWMTSNTAKVLNVGLTEHSLEEIITKVKNMAKVNSNGQMVQHMRVNSKTTTLTAKEHTSGQMRESSLEIGSIIKCMDEESSHGQMGEDTRESMLTTRRKDKECFSGLMDANTMGHGPMENSMG